MIISINVSFLKIVEIGLKQFFRSVYEFGKKANLNKKAILSETYQNEHQRDILDMFFMIYEKYVYYSLIVLKKREGIVYIMKMF